MKNRCLSVLVLTLALAVPAIAQEPPSASPEKLDDIRKLMNVIGMERLESELLEHMLENLKALLAGSEQDAKYQKMAERLPEILREEFKKLDFTAIGLELYDKYFTEDEIKGLVQFYSSPLGQKAIQTLPKLIEESMTRGTEFGRAAGMKAMDRWRAEFPELKQLEPPANPPKLD